MSRPSNRRSPLTFIVGVAALVLASTGVAYGVGDSGKHFRSLVFYERSTSAAPIDLGTPGPSAGDQFVFTSDLFSDSDFETKVGTVVGSCTLIDPKTFLNECGATARLADGDIQVNGAITGNSDFSVPVTGGAGRYRGVDGEIQITQINASDSKDTVLLLR
jgi:hypothetical protein